MKIKTATYVGSQQCFHGNGQPVVKPIAVGQFADWSARLTDNQSQMILSLLATVNSPECFQALCTLKNFIIMLKLAYLHKFMNIMVETEGVKGGWL